MTGCTPVPDKLIDTGEFEALLTILTLPVATPVADGVKVTFRVVASPGDKAYPDGMPLALYPAPAMAMLEIAMFELPPLVTFTDSVLVPPTFTLLKFKVDVLAASGPGDGALVVGGGGAGAAVTVTVA
jgi:hypothetical protein